MQAPTGAASGDGGGDGGDSSDTSAYMPPGRTPRVRADWSGSAAAVTAGVDASDATLQNDLDSTQAANRPARPPKPPVRPGLVGGSAPLPVQQACKPATGRPRDGARVGAAKPKRSRPRRLGASSRVAPLKLPPPLPDRGRGQGDHGRHGQDDEGMPQGGRAPPPPPRPRHPSPPCAEPQRRVEVRTPVLPLCSCTRAACGLRV